MLWDRLLMHFLLSNNNMLKSRDHYYLMLLKCEGHEDTDVNITHTNQINQNNQPQSSCLKEYMTTRSCKRSPNLCQLNPEGA